MKLEGQERNEQRMEAWAPENERDMLTMSEKANPEALAARQALRETTRVLIEQIFPEQK